MSPIVATTAVVGVVAGVDGSAVDWGADVSVGVLGNATLVGEGVAHADTPTIANTGITSRTSCVHRDGLIIHLSIIETRMDLATTL